MIKLRLSLIIKVINLNLKENIDAIKEELSTEEKFLESMIKSENFYKKNKKLVISAVVALIVGIFASMGYNYMKELNLKTSNNEYLQLISGKQDKSLENDLKSKNPKLYELYEFQTTLKSNDIKKLESLKLKLTDPILKDLLTYHLDSLSKKDLLDYVGKNGILKDFASLQKAYLELENKDFQKANEALEYIPLNSPIYELAKSLKHFTNQEQ